MRHLQKARLAAGFTLIEILVVVSVIALLVSILLPALSAARQTGFQNVCLGHLRTMGQGLVMYATDHDDKLVPGRLPRVDNENWQAQILGGLKYRPTFMAIMGNNVGIQPFDDPMPNRTLKDRFGEPGDRQNYASKPYTCPSAPDRTDERNGAYGYNYQFLGNSRLRDPADIFSFKNWPVSVTRIKDGSRTVAVADSMGTAATFAAEERVAYQNNGTNVHALGNEGFNLDPPRIAASQGEAAGYPDERSAIDPRHRHKAAVMYVDIHCDVQSPRALGYELDADGRYLNTGDNTLWSGTCRDEPWTETYIAPP